MSARWEVSPEIAKNDRVVVFGSTGLVGSAVVRELRHQGYEHVLTPTRAEIDLENEAAVRRWFEWERPDAVVLAAARVGGIGANVSRPYAFVAKNLAIAKNVIEAARLYKTRVLVNLGSSCIYPRDAEQPISESALLTGPLESTNRPYAVAKIAAIELCRAAYLEHSCMFVSAMPTNLYGSWDNFDPESGHVLPALVTRFLDANRRGDRSVTCWGTGSPLRELMHVDDCARAIVLVLERYRDPTEPINVGSGQEVSIVRLATMVADAVGYTGAIAWDPTRPDGTPRKLLDCRKLASLGFEAQIDLARGIAETVAWAREHS